MVKISLPKKYDTMSRLYTCFETGRMVTFPCSAREKEPIRNVGVTRSTIVRIARLMLSTTDLEWYLSAGACSLDACTLLHGFLVA